MVIFDIKSSKVELFWGVRRPITEPEFGVSKASEKGRCEELMQECLKPAVYGSLKRSPVFHSHCQKDKIDCSHVCKTARGKTRLKVRCDEWCFPQGRRELHLWRPPVAQTPGT